MRRPSVVAPIVLAAGLFAAAACQNATVDPLLPSNHPQVAGWSGPPPDIQVLSEDSQQLTVHVPALVLLTRWPGLQDPSLQVLTVTNPRGQVYQTFRSPIAPGQDVEVRVPIQGTYVEDRNWSGTWTVQVYLNSATLPAGTASFELLP